MHVRIALPVFILLAAATPITAGATRPPPGSTPPGATLVAGLSQVSGDRLSDFAPLLGDLSAFPGTEPDHADQTVAFEKSLAERLGVISVKLDTVANPMVGDDKNPPVSTLTLQLDAARTAQAVEAIKRIRLAHATQTKAGTVWEVGRISISEGAKELSWSFSRPAALTADWDNASLEATRSQILAIVRDPTDATLTNYVEGVKKRASHRDAATWDDEHITYSFNVTDTPKFIDLYFARPLSGGPLLRQLGFPEVTFEEPCDANFIEVLTKNGSSLTSGKWELSFSAAPSADFAGSVQVCTAHDAVKPVSADRVMLTGARLSLAVKH